MPDYNHREWLVEEHRKAMCDLVGRTQRHLKAGPKNQVRVVVFLVDNRGNVTSETNSLRYVDILPDHIFYDAGRMEERERDDD